MEADHDCEVKPGDYMPKTAQLVGQILAKSAAEKPKEAKKSVAIFCAYVFVPTHIFWSVLFWCLPSCCQLWVAYCFSAHICESGVFVPTIWFLILLYPLFCCLRIPAHLMVRDGFVPTPW